MAAAMVIAAVFVSPASAQETDPVALGWMRGAPPAAEQQVRFDNMSFLQFPRTRWSFSNMRQLMPTVNVSRGERVSRLRTRLRDDLDDVTFAPLGGGAPMTWAQSLAHNYTDAILILHRGRIVYERYFGVTTASTPHLSFSVTKSYVGVLTAMLIAEGRLDENAPVGRYLPELAESGFADATVRQILDMTTGLAYSEDYADPRADVHQFALAGSIYPRPSNYNGPDGFYPYLATVAKQGEHGAGFTYRSVNTEVLGWLIARVTGESLADVISERIWRPMGAESDAYFLVDRVGAAWAAGGLNATLRDHARFGEMMRLGGRFNGRQIIPSAIVADIRRGGRQSDFTQTAYPGWGSYRSQWWISHNSHGAFAARGVYGQTIYIDPTAEMVIVRFASHPTASNVLIDPASLPAYEAVAARLMHGD